MPTPGEGVKAGWHGVGPVVDPDRRSFAPEPRQRAALQNYARRWLPGVDPDSLTDISCTYTTTADENFVLDRIGPVVIGAGFSGHGFKFTPPWWDVSLPTSRPVKAVHRPIFLGIQARAPLTGCRQVPMRPTGVGRLRRPGVRR